MSFHGVSYGPRTVSGAGSLASLGGEVAALTGKGASVLLVADSGLRPFGIVDRAAKALRDAGLSVEVYSEIAGEPKEAQVEAARTLGKLAETKAVVCLGGGSALDAGKLAAAVLSTDMPVSTFRLAGEPLPEKFVSIVCVPTTAGTGSEMTGISVVSDASKTKFWFWGAPLEADLALLDPELTVGLPPKFTAMTGMDALVHAIEAATNRHASPESDAAAYQAIRMVVESLPIAVREPKNIDAREKMLEAAALAGLAIHRAGTALAHNIGHALGSLAPVPHGLAVTLAMAATAEWVVEGNREDFARVAEAMGEGADADKVPAAFRRLATEVGLDLSTHAAAPGLTAEALAAAMAAPENAAMRKSTKRLVADEDLLPLAEMTLRLKPNLLPGGEGGREAAG
jgi:alcohol dehydrogenase class IV